LGASGWRWRKTDARAQGAQAEPSAHRRTYFFHASNYYRMSDVLLTLAEEPKRRERFRKSQESFEATKLHAPKIEVITVRCGRRIRRLLCHRPFGNRKIAGGVIF
jgi:hypothetical protein